MFRLHLQSLTWQLQGGPAKVKPTYIFAGNIILVTCIGKIQCFWQKCDNSLDTHLGKRKNLIFNIVRQMAKNHRFLPTHSNVTSKVGLTLAGAGPPCISCGAPMGCVLGPPYILMILLMCLTSLML